MSSLANLQIAMRFSLWMWALYWPGQGLAMLAGGLMDPISMIVLALLIAGFVLITRMGAIQTEASNNMKQFLIERPMYVIGAAVLLAVIGAFVAELQVINLAIFALLYLAGIILLGVALVRHVQDQELHWRKSRADQLLIAVVISAFGGLMIALDAMLPVLGGQETNSNTLMVATVNWVSFLYPGLILVSSRPFRPPLRNPFKRAAKRAPDQEIAAVPALAARPEK